jgi:LysM repeat protein
MGTVAPKVEGRILEVNEEDGNHLYTVKEGDYLAKISKMFNVKIDTLLKTNDIENIDMIYVGQKINIPM